MRYLFHYIFIFVVNFRRIKIKARNVNIFYYKNKESNAEKWLRQLFDLTFFNSNEFKSCFENEFQNNRLNDI